MPKKGLGTSPTSKVPREQALGVNQNPNYNSSAKVSSRKLLNTMFFSAVTTAAGEAARWR